MGKKIASLAVLLVAVVAVVMPAAGEETKADSGMVILRGDQLNESITSFDKGEWGPIDVILKLYEGVSRQPGYRVYLNMYGDLPDFDDFERLASAPKHKFLIPLSVRDDTKPLDEEHMDILSPDKPAIYDRNSLECGNDKFMLIKKHDGIYLMMADRPAFDEAGEIISQNEAAPLEIKLFKLNGGYFLRVAERKTEEKVCSPKDFYQQMTMFAESALK